MKNYTVEWFEARCADHGACTDVARSVAQELAKQYTYERMAHIALNEQIEANIKKRVSDWAVYGMRCATPFDFRTNNDS
jgi:hypothetical protein